MSRTVVALVYSRKIGSMARKAILAYCADRANDDGSGVWASKRRIADEVECSRQTVVNVLRDLVGDGLIVKVGKRRCPNGYTDEYAIVIEAVASLPKAQFAPVVIPEIDTPLKLDPSTSFTPRPQPALPKPSLNRPILAKKKSKLLSLSIFTGGRAR